MNTAQQEVAARAETVPTAEPTQRAFHARSPRVDVTETPEAYFVTADVPGVAMDDIDVTVEENRLQLTATRTPVSYDGYKAAFRQFGEGEYRRAFTIPEEIDRPSIRAQLRDGVLRVTLPKAQPAQPQKVQIQIG